MSLALHEARLAAERGEVPVGAVITDAKGRVIARAGNEVEGTCDPTAHAELLALRRASQALGQQRLTDCDLHVTLEPCALCAAAISMFRIRRLYFGAYDAKGGAVEHGPRLFEQKTILHKPEIYGGIAEQEAGELLRGFFQDLRPGPNNS